MGVKQRRTYQILAAEMDDIDREFRKAGFKVRPAREIPRDEIRNILEEKREYERDLLNGNTTFVIKDYREYANGRDTVRMTDFDLRSIQRVDRDPIVTVLEEVPGRTSDIVRDILAYALRINAMVYQHTRGPGSRIFQRCLKEIAMLENKTEVKVLESLPQTKKPRPIYWTENVYERPILT